MGTNVRRARIADAAVIREIDAGISEDRRLEVGCQPLEYYQDWLACHDKRHPVFIGTEEGVVWWMALSPCPGGYPFDGVALVEMGVPDHLSGTEFTDALLRYLEQRAIRLGHYKLLACLDARQRYLLHTYRRAGFRDVGTLRSQAYHKGRLADMVLMERLLPADLEALKEHYVSRYDCYRDYFEEERRRAEAEAQGEYALEYEEVETPEDQLPEGIVRFLRTKRTPDGQPVRHPVPAGPGEGEAPGEETPPAGEESPGDAPAPGAPQPAVPAPTAGQPQLPEGIIRFLRSKRLPDGSLVDQELPPVVPVKLSPAQLGRPAPEPAAEETDGEA